jgi:hypothetical protein
MTGPSSNLVVLNTYLGIFGLKKAWTWWSFQLAQRAFAASKRNIKHSYLHIFEPTFSILLPLVFHLYKFVKPLRIRLHELKQKRAMGVMSE